jgi:UDP-GlcNAc:undecaprenyl-phosphate GlcNAc-1-phosphate transferase
VNFHLPPLQQYGLTLAFGFLTAALLTPVVARLARARGVVAAPRRDRWHKAPTPLLGGVAIYFASMLVVLTFANVDARLAVVLFGATLLFITGLVDDLVHLRPQTKLLIQIGAAGALVMGGVRVETPSLSFVSAPLTILWVVGLTNAFNLLDNMDGLAAGIAAIASFVLFIFSFGLGNDTTALLSLSVMAGALGFLMYNFHPARVFMGDSGSMYIGFVLSAISLLGTREMASNVVLTLLVPVVIMGLPIFDTTLVTIARSLSGRPISQGGSDHVSHRLVALGLSQRQTALVLYFIAAAFGGLAVLSRSLGFWPTVGLATLMFAATAVFGAFLAQVRIYSEERLLARSSEDPQSTRTIIGGMFMYKREMAQVLLDSVLVCAAYLCAYLLKYGEGAYGSELAGADLITTWPRQFGESLTYVLVIKLAALFAFQAYRGIWRYAGVRDLVRMVEASTVASVVAAVAVPLLLPHEMFARTLWAIDWLLFTTFLVGTRASFVVLSDLFRQAHRSMAPRVLIVGAGDVGEMVLRFILRSESQAYNPIGFLDDDPAKGRRSIHGVRVLGRVGDLPSIIEGIRPNLIVVAMASEVVTVTDIASLCRAYGIPVFDAGVFLAGQMSPVALPPAST